MEAWPSGPVTVAIGRAILGPAGRIAPPAGETVLLAVEAGALGLDGEERTVAAGGGLLRPVGSAHEVRNAAGGLLVLLVLTVAPAAA
ncbi:MAG: hypothetical protein ACRDJW_18985 [Thermomicrobiales bacterium]